LFSKKHLILHNNLNFGLIEDGFLLTLGTQEIYFITKEHFKSPHLTLAKRYWQQWLEPDQIVIDATCGNGRDTLFVAQHLGARVIAIDLQQTAVEKTKQTIEDHQLKEKVTCYCASHEQLRKYCVEPNLVIYNLGYLPGGNKQITTMRDSTLNSLKEALTILHPKGALSITLYPGHEEGWHETQAVLRWAKTLPSDEWSAIHHEWINRSKAPSFLWINRRASSIK
jgi:SAM-dependent methyltransferase